MPDMTVRPFFVWLKDWWEIALFTTLAITGYFIKLVKAYKLTHSSAHKIAAIEKILKNDMVLSEVCTQSTERCQERNEAQFKHGQEAFDGIRGHLDRIDQKIDDNHRWLVNAQMEIANGKGDK